MYRGLDSSHSRILRLVGSFLVWKERGAARFEEGSASAAPPGAGDGDGDGADGGDGMTNSR